MLDASSLKIRPFPPKDEVEAIPVVHPQNGETVALQLLLSGVEDALPPMLTPGVAFRMSSGSRAGLGTAPSPF